MDRFLPNRYLPDLELPSVPVQLLPGPSCEQPGVHHAEPTCIKLHLYYPGFVSGFKSGIRIPIRIQIRYMTATTISVADPKQKFWIRGLIRIQPAVSFESESRIRIQIQNVYFGSSSDPDPAKSWIRIQIHWTEAWIRGSGSTPKCHGSATLVQILILLIKNKNKTV